MRQTIVYYGDLIRAFAHTNSDEERESVAGMMGFEKAQRDNEKTANSSQSERMNNEIHE